MKKRLKIVLVGLAGLSCVGVLGGVIGLSKKNKDSTVADNKDIVKVWKVEGLGNESALLKSTLSIDGGKTYNSPVTYNLSGTDLNKVITTSCDYDFNFEKVLINGNWFIKIPTFYKKFSRVVDGELKDFEISKTKVNDDFKPYPLFVRSDGTISDFYYVGAYKGYVSDGKLSSKVGVIPTGASSLGSFRTCALANGNGYSIGDIWYKQFISDLFCVAFKTTNLDFIFKNTIASNKLLTGASDKTINPCGVFDGRLKLFNIEDVVFNGFEFLDGMIIKNSKAYVQYDYTKYSSVDITSFSLLNYNLASAGYVSHLGFDFNNPFANVPLISGGSTNSYYCDQWIVGVKTDVLYTTIWGGVNSISTQGLWYFDCSHNDTFLSDVVSARLCYHV